MTRERKAELVHRGGMHFSATTGTGRTLEFGDFPGQNQASPVETIAAAIAACSAMDVVSILEKKRQVVDAYRVSVSAIQRDEYPQVLTRIDILHDVTGTAVTEVAVRRAVELSARKYCPVNAMLSAGATEVTHRYRVQQTGDGEVVAASGVIEGVAAVTGPYQRPDPVD